MFLVNFPIEQLTSEWLKYTWMLWLNNCYVEKQIVFSSENAEGNLEVYEEIEVEVPKEVVSLDLFTFHVH